MPQDTTQLIEQQKQDLLLLLQQEAEMRMIHARALLQDVTSVQSEYVRDAVVDAALFLVTHDMFEAAFTMTKPADVISGQRLVEEMMVYVTLGIGAEALMIALQAPDAELAAYVELAASRDTAA